MVDDWQSVHQPTHEPYLVVQEFFSESECNLAIEVCSQYPERAALTYEQGSFKSEPKHRKLHTAYLPRNQETLWLFEKMDALFLAVARRWDICVRETVEDLKYLRYEEGDHFSKWHMDAGAAYTKLRKISMSIELVSSSGYEGGELQIFPLDSGHVAGCTRKAGTAVVFPSHVYHRVTPVTKGVRHGLVNWISGPTLR